MATSAAWMQLGRVLGPQTVERDPDAGPYLDLAILDHDGLAERGDDPVGDLARFLDARPVSSIRTANSSPPKRAAVSPPRRQSVRRLATATRRLSPAAWPRLSLTSLKSSRSRKSTARRGLGPGRPVEGVLETVPEQGPVGQPAQRVVEGLVLELLLQALALAHVPEGEDDPLDGLVAQQVGGDHLDVVPRSVLVLDPPLGGDRGAATERHAR